MKKLLTVATTMLLAGTLAFAQTGGGSTDKQATTTPPKTEASGKKATKTSKTKSHKGGKKGKKGSTETGTTTPPK